VAHHQLGGLGRARLRLRLGGLRVLGAGEQRVDPALVVDRHDDGA
jgi:hypothetical protein